MLPDGRLQLSTNNSDSIEGGSGMMPLFPMGNPLPTIPSDVGAVTISWHANEMVSKGLILKLLLTVIRKIIPKKNLRKVFVFLLKYLLFS